MDEEQSEGVEREEFVTRQIGASLERLPARLRDPVESVLSRWLGRTLIRTATASVRVGLFDRAMTIAAQFFTSVLPILILATTWAGKDEAEAISNAMGMPEESRSLIDQALSSSETAAFGIVGTLFVLGSATSLSRALTRAFVAIWQVRRPKGSIGTAWRWLAVVLVLALALVVGHTLSEQAKFLPPRAVWPVALSLLTDVGVAVFVPWVLLAGIVGVRQLLPGALVFAVVMLGVRPAADAWLPRALETSAERYGPIGLAFTYLAWLYVVSFIFVAATILGQVLATDRGRLGRWIRGPAAPEQA